MSLSLSLSLSLGSQPYSGGTPTPTPTPPPEPPLTVAVIRPAFNRTKQTYTSTQSDGINTNGKYVIRHKAFDYDVEGDVRFWFANRYSETNAANAITVSAEYEYPYLSDTWTAMTFGGSGSIAIPVGGADVASDPIALEVAAGEYIRTRTLVVVASAGMEWPILDRLFLAAASNEGALLSTSSLASDPVPDSDSELPYGPVAITGLTKAPIALGVFGDSISGGAYGDSTLDEIGWIQKVVSPVYPVVQLNTGGETAANFVTSHGNRMALADQCGLTHAHIAYGTNDGGSDAATLEANLGNIAKLCHYRNWRVSMSAITTDTASSNDWINAAGQSYTSSGDDAPGGKNDVVNAWMAGLPTYVDKFVDPRPGYQDGDNKVLTDGTPFKYTVDGLHPSEFGYANMASLLNFYDFIDPTPLDSGVPAVMASAVLDLDAETLRGVLADGATVTSWSDSYGNTATGSTGAPSFVETATPNGKASVKFESANSERMTVPTQTSISNIFGVASLGGYVVEIFKQVSKGGGGFGRHWSKGEDRVGSGASNESAVMDFSTTDPVYSVGSFTVSKWSIYGYQLRSDATTQMGFRVDSARVRTVAPSPGAAGTYVDNSASTLYIGNGSALNRGFDGEMHRLVMWKGSPDSIDREVAFVYLRRLAGIVF